MDGKGWEDETDKEINDSGFKKIGKQSNNWNSACARVQN